MSKQTGGTRPDSQQLLAAKDKTVPDVIAPELDVLFCGINPSLYSAAVGQHFARPGNRFWPTLYRAGFTDRLLHPSESGELLRQGCGITNIVARATATAAELSPEELRKGQVALTATVERWRPRWLAVLGIGAYRQAFARPKATLGPQPERIGDAGIWVLPNPSGLNAHYQLADLAALFSAFREAAHAQSNRNAKN